LREEKSHLQVSTGGGRRKVSGITKREEREERIIRRNSGTWERKGVDFTPEKF